MFYGTVEVTLQCPVFEARQTYRGVVTFTLQTLCARYPLKRSVVATRGDQEPVVRREITGPTRTEIFASRCERLGFTECVSMTFIH
jgi:hypothetical protein